MQRPLPAGLVCCSSEAYPGNVNDFESAVRELPHFVRLVKSFKNRLRQMRRHLELLDHESINLQNDNYHNV